MNQYYNNKVQTFVHKRNAPPLLVNFSIPVIAPAVTKAETMDELAGSFHLESRDLEKAVLVIMVLEKDPKTIRKYQ